MPTAPNDSQKPGVSPAHGSHSSTTASAHSQTTPALPGTRDDEADRGDGQHQQRSHRGHLRAREQHVAEREHDADRRRDAARRNARRQRDAAPRERKREAAGKRGEDRHVQPRNADEVRDARAIEHAPLRLGNRALLADRQRDDHARVGRVRKRREDARAHALARALDVVRRAPGERIEQRIAIAASDVAGGAQAALEHPRLDVEPVRVDRAVRPLQSHDEAPALARRDVGHLIAVPSLRTCAYQASDRRAGTIARGVSMRSTAKAKRVPRADDLRQVVDDADERDIDALPFGRQRVGEPDLRAPARVAEAQRAGSERGKHRRHDACDERFAGESPQRDRERRRDDCAAQPRRSRRQLGPPLQPHDAGGKRCQRRRQQREDGQAPGLA